MSRPTLLALDTATAICSVALARADAIDLRSLEVGQRHSEHVLPMIDALLAAHRIALRDCEAIAFGAGPGSFTGLRIACGIAQGLAYGAGRPVVPVGNLAALAWQAARGQAGVRRVLAAIDARMSEVYWGIYDIAGDDVREVMPPALAEPASLVLLADEHAADAIAGDALLVFPQALTPFNGRRFAHARADAAAIAVLARKIFVAGGAVEPAQAAPLYVRDRVALTVDERNAIRAAGEVT